MSKGHNIPPSTPSADRDNIDPAEREIQTRFLRERWDALAALDWERYAVEGRGAIVLNIVSTDGSGQTDAFYASEQAMQAQGMAWPDADTARMVAAYQPEQEIVIAVPRENGGNSTYQLQGSPAPPAAYRRRERDLRTPSTA